MFCRNSGKDQHKIIQQAQEIVKNLADKDVSNGKKYLKIMKIAKGKCVEFINAEIDRITKLLETKLNQDKSSDLSKNLNVLKSFQKSGIKDEL